MSHYDEIIADALTTLSTGMSIAQIFKADLEIAYKKAQRQKSSRPQSSSLKAYWNKVYAREKQARENIRK